MDPKVSHPDSITRFLNMPTITKRNKPNTKDPIVNFPKFVILTSEEYIAATTLLRDARKNAIKEKEQNIVQKEEMQKRKAA